MARVINLYEAKSQLSALVEEAAAGGEVIIAKNGRPRAKLVAATVSKRRRPGGSQGKLRIAADFDSPLPRELLEAFIGGGRRK